MPVAGQAVAELAAGDVGRGQRPAPAVLAPRGLVLSGLRVQLVLDATRHRHRVRLPHLRRVGVRVRVSVGEALLLRSGFEREEMP